MYSVCHVHKLFYVKGQLKHLHDSTDIPKNIKCLSQTSNIFYETIKRVRRGLLPSY